MLRRKSMEDINSILKNNNSGKINPGKNNDKKIMVKK